MDWMTNINERGAYPHPVEELEPAPESELLILADGLGRLLDWVCQTGKPSIVGKRTLVVAYLLRPDMVQCGSEAELARGLGVSRADVSKLVNDFRDTFGVRTAVMRSEETRDKCRKAQK